MILNYVEFAAVLLAVRWLLGPVGAFIVMLPSVYITEWSLRRRGLPVGSRALKVGWTTPQREEIVNASDTAARECLDDGRGLVVGIASGVMTAHMFPGGPGWVYLAAPVAISYFGGRSRIVPGLVCLGAQLLVWKII